LVALSLPELVENLSDHDDPRRVLAMMHSLLQKAERGERELLDCVALRFPILHHRRGDQLIRELHANIPRVVAAIKLQGADRLGLQIVDRESGGVVVAVSPDVVAPVREEGVISFEEPNEVFPLPLRNVWPPALARVKSLVRVQCPYGAAK